MKKLILTIIAVTALSVVFAMAAIAAFQINGIYKIKDQMSYIRFDASESIQGGYIGNYTKDGVQYLGNLFNANGDLYGTWYYDNLAQHPAGMINASHQRNGNFSGIITLFLLEGTIEAQGPIRIR